MPTWGSRRNWHYAQHDMRHEESMWSPQAERPALGAWNVRWGLHIDLA
jgi:hypothetical protein